MLMPLFAMKYHIEFDIELLKNPYKGIYIALEGIDGSGKTTQVQALADAYRKKGRRVLVTQEPRREGVVGEIIHKVLKKEVKVPPIALQYLFTADRAIHQEEVIIPALKDNKVVISDRTFWSGITYGMLDRDSKDISKENERLLTSLSILSMYHQFTAPDATFYLNTSVQTAFKRLKGEGRPLEYYESEGKLEKVKEIYDWVYKKYPKAMVNIHGERPINEVTEEILTLVNK